MRIVRPSIVFLAASVLFFGACRTAPPRATKLRDRAEIVNYVRHYDERMAASSGRMSVLRELTYFHPRNSKLYPPFLRQLLSDPSPRLRWEALSRLDEHGIRVDADELPKSVETPMGQLLDRTDKDSIARIKKQATDMGPAGGWAIKALGLMRVDTGDQAEILLKSENIFVRYSAAVSLIQFGKSEAGAKALRQITKAQDDASGFYRMAAAERLWRMGEKQYIETIFDLFNARSSYADGPIDILEDLTGEYFLTEQEWRRWWDKVGKGKYL